MLREVKVTFSDGDIINTNIAENITDSEIYKYYKIGQTFNLGIGEKDHLVKVVKVEILK